MKALFIIVPALVPTGPIKGAIALANAACDTVPVKLVDLKGGQGANAPLDSRVELVSLRDVQGFASKRAVLRAQLEQAGGRRAVLSVSYCFSADMMNLACRSAATTCISVRGNLLRNYRMDYRLAGLPLAVAHLMSLRWADHVVAMTSAMARQVSCFSGSHPVVIGNFVDESPLEDYRTDSRSDGRYRFVFLGSLTQRKQPLLAVAALGQLVEQGIDASLDIVGTGPLADEIYQAIQARSLTSRVTVHGFLANPCSLLATADALVLPSLSEGISRASLEALYLGVPCVLRQADGNEELITEENGALFLQDGELSGAMIRAAQVRRRYGRSQNLLPPAFRQALAVRRYLALGPTA